jgi:hypothetical protein
MTESLENRLQGSQFRWLNEVLYTSKSGASKALFDEQPELFDAVCHSHIALLLLLLLLSLSLSVVADMSLCVL